MDEPQNAGNLGLLACAALTGRGAGRKIAPQLRHFPGTTTMKSMQKTVLGTTLLACFALATAVAQTPPPAAGAAAAGGRKARIAIVDFDYATVHGGISAIFGSNVDVGKGVTDLLVSYLVKDGSYSVIERKALDTVLAEQNFSNSDRADATSAAKIGKMLGVDAIIVGSITQFGNDTKNTGVGAVGGGLGKIGLGGFKQKQSKAIVGLTARLVNVDTGEILASAEGMGESKRTATSLGGGGGGWGGFGGGKVDFGNSNFQSTIIGEAVKAAVEQMSGNVIAERGRVQVRQVLVQGLVAAVAGPQIVLNIGSRAGVKVGDQLSVERVSQEIKDPATGKVIRRLSSSLGILRVVDVDDQSSVAEIVSGTGFKVSDMVKSVVK
jgi:curli biogenesis system outer membrane secretion channel CsgG